MFRYTQVIVALAKIHHAYPRSISAFRGRVQHLQKLGIAPIHPGKGSKIQYSLEDVMKWALALEISEFGTVPTAIKRIVDKCWPFVEPLMTSEIVSEKYLIIGPSIVSYTFDAGPDVVMYIHDGNKFDLSSFFRAMIVNLGELHRKVVESLENSAADPLVVRQHAAT